MNEQPWAQLAATATRRKSRDCSPAWSRAINCGLRRAAADACGGQADVHDRNGAANSHAFHDVGLAVGNLPCCVSHVARFCCT